MSEKFTESFEQFSSGLGTTDVLLYAGIALFLWYMFKDKMGGVIDLVTNLVGRATSRVQLPSSAPVVTVPATNKSVANEDVFFQLVTCWKQMRDLAVRAKCLEAVKAIDQMFPYLSPNSCNKSEGEVK